MTENRFVLLVFVSVQEIVIFNCYDRAGFPDMNYETLDQILWKCHHVVPNSSWYIHWRRLKLSNRHLNISMVYTKRLVKKKKHHETNRATYTSCTVLSREAKEFWMLTQGINKFDTVDIKMNLKEGDIFVIMVIVT